MPDVANCVGCGIESVNGILRINSNQDFPYPDGVPVEGVTCLSTSGRNLYLDCDATLAPSDTNGRLHGEPEKFFMWDEATIEHTVGNAKQLYQFFNPVSDFPVTPLKTSDGPFMPTFNGPFGAIAPGGDEATFSLTNPSPCLTMRIVVRFGLEHAQIVKINKGSSEIVIGVYAEISGDGAIPFAEDTGGQPVGHQSWRHSTNSDDFQRIIWDTQGAYSLRRYILSPGGTVTVKLNPYLDVRLNNGTTTIQAWRSRIEVFGASRSYAETLTDLATT